MLGYMRFCWCKAYWDDNSVKAFTLSARYKQKTAEAMMFPNGEMNKLMTAYFGGIQLLLIKY